MNNSWPKTTLEDVCIRITDGAHASPKSVVSGLPMASVKDLTQFGINMETCRHISTDDFNKLVRQGCKPEVGDILISKDGASALDTVCEIRHELNVVLLSSVAILKPNGNKITSSFLHYFLDCETTRQYLKNGFITGAAIPRVILKDFKRCEIALPPLPTQRKIATILSAYDDLIENNTRRIKILEAMAQALYREWFVKFRFPGNETVKMVESELGMVPEGWEIKQLGDVVKNVRISVKPGPQTLDLPYVPIDCLPRKSLALSESKPGSEAQSSLFSFKKYDILFGAMRSYFHKVVIAPFDGTTRSTCFVLRPIEESNYSYAVLTLFEESTVSYSSKHSRGTTIPYAVWDGALENMPNVMPPEELRSNFNRIVKPTLERIAISLFRQANLRRTRDLLLPKLISGEVDVEKIDVLMPQ